MGCFRAYVALLRLVLLVNHRILNLHSLGLFHPLKLGEGDAFLLHLLHVLLVLELLPLDPLVRLDILLGQLVGSTHDLLPKLLDRVVVNGFPNGLADGVSKLFTFVFEFRFHTVN